jgi:hypothetical protein
VVANVPWHLEEPRLEEALAAEEMPARAKAAE